MGPAPAISFEFFPPATERAEASFWTAVDRLATLQPSFVSLTYGACGSTRDRNDRILRALLRREDLIPAAHITCAGMARPEVDALAADWGAAGIRRIVALRGDTPGTATQFTPHPDGYRNAVEFVAGLRRIAEFDISVAAYPEGHPDAASPAADLDHLKRKIEAGASRAITQYFFDPEPFLRFRDRVATAGIHAPIVPGVLPIVDFAKVLELSRRCGATVPAWLAARFAGLNGDAETSALVAAATTVELCRRLHSEGVEAFHFYTLNRAALPYAACRSLGVMPVPVPTEEAA